ncbi:MAG: N-acetyltransferase [Nitrospinae bacterium CG11_big_fil_rev_8_21_14_0_20_56_8]|nr:MAG: N-acetyltransferase [Nitrospinae bacterium CG11_big_fil_rev_8_21_14_0_20_56_8]
MNPVYRCIADDVVLGEDVFLSQFINLYGCRIGSRTRIGAFVEIQKGVTVGNDCKIQSHSFLCEGVSLGERVFIGHGVIFINDRVPRTVNPGGATMRDGDWAVVPTRIDDEASIGSGATILCGIHIGKGAVIGAGSVVTKDVPPGEVWAGNPAKFINLRGDR